jgi:hypothetical protein
MNALKNVTIGREVSDSGLGSELSAAGLSAAALRPQASAAETPRRGLSLAISALLAAAATLVLWPSVAAADIAPEPWPPTSLHSSELLIGMIIGLVFGAVMTVVIRRVVRRRESARDA